MRAGKKNFTRPHKTMYGAYRMSQQKGIECVGKGVLLQAEEAILYK